MGHHHAAVVYDDRLYLVGGISKGSHSKLQIYDPASDSWESHDLGFEMGAAAAVLMNTPDGMRIHACGGIDGSNQTINSCFRLDPNPATNPNYEWDDTMPDMPIGVNHAAHAVVKGKFFYVIGGRQGGNSVTNGRTDV